MPRQRHQTLRQRLVIHPKRPPPKQQKLTASLPLTAAKAATRRKETRGLLRQSTLLCPTSSSPCLSLYFCVFSDWRSIRVQSRGKENCWSMIWDLPAQSTAQEDSMCVCGCVHVCMCVCMFHWVKDNPVALSLNGSDRQWARETVRRETKTRRLQKVRLLTRPLTQTLVELSGMNRGQRWQHFITKLDENSFMFLFIFFFWQILHQRLLCIILEGGGILKGNYDSV